MSMSISNFVDNMFNIERSCQIYNSLSHIRLNYNLLSTLKTTNDCHEECQERTNHYSDVIMGVMATQISSLMIVYSTVYSGANQRNHQRSASLAFVRGIHQWPVNSPHKGPVTQKKFPFDDVIMKVSISNIQSWCNSIWHIQCCLHLWPLLLTWFNFNPSMDM